MQFVEIINMNLQHHYYNFIENLVKNIFRLN